MRVRSRRRRGAPARHAGERPDQAELAVARASLRVMNPLQVELLEAAA